MYFIRFATKFNVNPQAVLMNDLDELEFIVKKETLTTFDGLATFLLFMMSSTLEARILLSFNKPLSYLWPSPSNVVHSESEKHPGSEIGAAVVQRV